MTYGQQLKQARSRASQQKHAEAFVPYETMKISLRDGPPPPAAFANSLRLALDDVDQHAQACSRELTEEVLRLASAQTPGGVPVDVLEPVTRELGALLGFIAANGIGLHRIAKK